MNIITQKLELLTFDVSNHQNIKQPILDAISSMGTHSNIDNNQSISNTDWHLNSNVYRPYFDYINPIINTIGEEIQIMLKIPERIKLLNYWFQQYKKNDYHTWHIHGGCNFSCVYYVNLNDDNAKTTFRLLDGSEFEVDVKEGSILIFPSYLPHTSKSNNSDVTKTVIAFNIGS